MLTVIDRGIKYSDKIVNDLLEYSREIRLEVSESNPRSVAEAALLQVECSQNIVLKNLTRETPKILIDVTKVQRVFMNLIKNAIDAMPRGGELTITSKESNGILELKFTDTGEGIPENVMRDLWKPLRTSKPKGLGLGLVICKRIVEAHGGSIHAKSITGKGSTFTIRLPINQNVRTNPNSEMEPEFCNSPNYDAVTG
jgi:signal transduction histidine kinase